MKKYNDMKRKVFIAVMSLLFQVVCLANQFIPASIPEN